jgi:hypothetical protein
VKNALTGDLSTTAAPPPSPATRRMVLLTVVVLIVVGLVRLLFMHHTTKYEQIAGDMTLALQSNDLAGVEKFQNAETATQVTHAIVGRDADVFAPLGKLDEVRETAVDADRRIHQFTVTFDKATVHETIRFDPDDKVVGFQYDPPVAR